MLPASGSAVDQRSPNQGDRESPVETWRRRQGGVHCSRALLLQKLIARDAAGSNGFSDGFFGSVSTPVSDRVQQSVRYTHA